MAAAGLQVREAGRALRVQTEAPHLVSMGSGRLSTAVTLHPLPEGRTVLGSNRDADIPIVGTGVEPVHCVIENDNGVVTLYPINGSTAMDGSPINSPVGLVQGCMLSIGRSNYMRFNHPAEAKRLRSTLPQSRISMAPISFALPPQSPDNGPPTISDNPHLERKPPVAPRKSPRNSYSDDEIGFLGKLTKFEMLAKQNGVKSNCVSPKVFPPGALTTNVPANQILLGPSKSPIATNKPNARYNQTSVTENHKKNQQQMNGSMSRSMICQGSNDLNDDFPTREFDMSQSLIVAKTTTTEYLQFDKFPSSPIVYRGNSKANFKRNTDSTNTRKIQPSSPAFDRNPTYNYADQNRFGICRNRVTSPTSSVGSSCSLEELRERQIDAENKRKEAETMKKNAQEERLKEQEVERLEKMRLEEILAMCAEYERQSRSADKPRQPNRIITNGSLPRDKRLGYGSPYGSPKSPSKSQAFFSFDTSKFNTKSSSCENLPVQNSPTRLGNGNHQVCDSPTSGNCRSEENERDQSQVTTPNNNTERTIAFSNSITQSRCPNYENTNFQQFDNGYRDTNRNNNNRSQNYENVIPSNGNVSVYENVGVPPLSYNNNLNNKTMRKNGTRTNSCQVIENKLAISNDQLFEAIEQLSMLSSKSKETSSTSKKNNNFERDNGKSNEAKADKQRRQHELEDRKKYIEFLQNEKVHILGNMDALKRSVADIEIQEEEIGRELELEKALLSAEYEAESLKVSQDEGEKIRVQMRINELEREMSEDHGTQAKSQAEAKNRVLVAQQNCNRLEEDDLAICGNAELRQKIMEELIVQQEILESEKKAFEDLEFHHLEEEASKLATREELQRYLTELSTRIETRRARMNYLDLQKSQVNNSAVKDTRSLERQKLGHLKRLEEGRNRLRAINDELTNSTENPSDNPDEKRSPSREDFDRISRITNDSPIVNNQGSLGRKTIESLKAIERNRQLHLSKQGSQVISDERRRVEELKRRVQDEVRSQWEERKLNCASFNSIESGEESSSYSTGPTESGSGSSDLVAGSNGDKISPSKLSEATSLGPGPSNHDNTRDDGRGSMEGGRSSNNSGVILDDPGSRPLSQTSSEMDSLGPLQPVKYRDKTKIQRPLTRYLPIKSESLDLRHHIETAGHQLPLIYDVSVDTTICKGYLSKMSKKFHHWNKRWFVFDRKKKSLSYYSDNTSRRARGVIYFQSIEEVYVDHLNSVKSPQPSLTFIIKTCSRLYHLMAPSPEAMRVWVDVVFTGAEGYREFDDDI